LGRNAAAEPGDLKLGRNAAAEPGDLKLGRNAAAEPGNLKLGRNAAAEPGDLKLGRNAAAEPGNLNLGCNAAAEPCPSSRRYFQNGNLRASRRCICSRQFAPRFRGTSSRAAASIRRVIRANQS
ncbi:MAG: hypothetical protein IJ268_06110, partial [Proteobacteria bacterium]|nr:hypothetical protein [Pseudomonadota bacterium]